MMQRFFSFAACALLLTLAVAGCRGNANNVVLSSLDRSAKIQLFCADIDLLTGNLYDLQSVLPSELCTTETVFAPEISAQLLGAVTQTQTGEVAVVSFTTSTILDTNRTIPGVTALRVGEQPTGIQISPFEPSYTYVSSFSPKSVQAIPTEAIITGESALPTQQVRFVVGPTDLALHELASATAEVDDEGRTTGATSNIVYRYLYVALPELGEIAQIRVVPTTGEDGVSVVHGSLDELDNIVFLSLDTYDCARVESVTPPASDASDYHRICPEDFEDRVRRDIKTVETTIPCVDGPVPGPSPVALTIDYGLESDTTDDVLLVADANQPVIHRFELTALGAAVPDPPFPPTLPPIVTGAPTTDIDVTPYVPASSDPDDRAATQRYLYAVSAADSSVLVVNYTEDPEETPEDQKTFGSVLPVIAGVSSRANEENVESRNRVRFAFSNVRDIEVIAPFYEPAEDSSTGTVTVPEDDICSSSDGDAFARAQNESDMRGVFLAVSLSDGTMYFLDIYDLNAPCRGGEGAIACSLAETGPDQFASIRRHRRRFGFTPASFIAIDGTPSLQFNTAPGKLDEATGDPLNSDGPGLEFISCPEEDPRPSMFNVFGANSAPNGNEALICASSQVWSSFTQRWDARWGGLIPNSEGGLGLFADQSFARGPGNWFIGGGVPLCSVGVLGEQTGDGTDSNLSIDHLESYGGDRVLIVGELPPNTREDPDCEKFEDLREDVDDFPVWFPIIRAFNDELEIGPSPNPNRYSLDEVRFCFNQFTEYEIHTRDVYTVTGTTSGFIHRVVPDPVTGECVFDDSRPIEPDDVDTFLTGRAFEDTQFINPLVSFEIGAFPAETSVTDSTVALLNFNILNQFVVQVLDTSTARRSLPASMLFSGHQLFFVDFEAGVRRIVFSPLSIVQTFE
jgi:hypothetical protein